MRYLISFVFLISLLSCNREKKFEGKWTSDFLKETTETPKSVEFTQDSVSFNFWAFNLYHKYPFKVKRKDIWINNSRFTYKITDDTLSLNNINFYVKDSNDSISKQWFGKTLIDVKLPKNNTRLYKKESLIMNTAIHYYLFYGKRLDNESMFSLQLNDKYADIKDIPSFIASGHRNRHLPLPISLLFIDKSTKLLDLEKLLYEHQKVNFLKVKLVNNINLHFSDSLGLHYEYETLYKKLPPIFENITYSPGYSSEQIPPLPPFSSYYSEKDSSRINCFILKNNKYYHNKTKIERFQLKALVEESVKDNDIIISLYDLESNYLSFLEMNAIIDNVYFKWRNSLALKKYNKSFSELETSQSTEIEQQIPLKHIWSYSVPHYKHVLENNETFFGLNVKPIDSLLPKMDSASSEE